MTKKRMVWLAAGAVALAAVIALAVFFFNREEPVEYNNEVFTADFFEGVRAAYILKVDMFGDEPVDMLKGKRLTKLCNNLSGLSLTPQEQAEQIGLLYGGRLFLVLLYEKKPQNVFEINGKTLTPCELPYEEPEAPYIYYESDGLWEVISTYFPNVE